MDEDELEMLSEGKNRMKFYVLIWLVSEI
jgi:hypothetical protein